MDLIKGPHYLLRGLSLISQPGLRLFVLVPLLVNVLLFGAALVVLWSYFGDWLSVLLAYVPDWLSFITWIAWALFSLLTLLGVFFGFNVIANLIAAPFNGILAERVQARLQGRAPSGDVSLLRQVPRALGRELRKLSYYLPRLMGLLLLSVIPVVNLLAPFAWALFGAWMMAIQYVDYPMDNNGVSFADMRRQLARRRWLQLGFGGAVSVLLTLPFINLLVMPVAVAGATALWVEQYGLEAVEQQP